MPADNAAAVYGLTVPATGERVPASLLEFPVRIHITMAAIDPTAPPKRNGNNDLPAKTLATLKLIRVEVDDSEDEDEDDDEEDEYLKALVDGSDDDDDDSEDNSDDEPNGGPSDKSKAKSKKEKRAEALAQLAKAIEKDDEDEEMEDAKPNGTKASKKGKEKATDEEGSDEESDEDDEEYPFSDVEEYVLCTLDTERTYQQPLDITINENEIVFFEVSGNHNVTLTGNYIDIDEPDSEEEDDDYDLDPDQERMLLGEDSDEDSEDVDDESDELDDIDGPRVTELDSDDESDEAPQLVESAPAKGKNKRPAEDDAEGLDEMIAQDEKKLSKKQLKRMKNNKGEAVAKEEPKAAAKNAKGDKKVQFAKELEQGPTGSATKDKAGAAKGVKVVQGVTVDDRTIGSGRTVKNGDTVGLRYIGKLQSNGKQFDANKKGRPFYFKVGKGEVIKGWDIGLVGMQIGGERRLTIPPKLAYGAKGAGPDIPPNSTLIFDVKLLEIK